VRLVLHTAAYWLMLTVRDTIDKPHPLANAEFTTLRMRLVKIAARITETATRVRVAFAAACRTTHCFAASPLASSPPVRNTTGAPSPHTPNPANINAVMNLTDFAMKQATCSNAPAPQTAPSTSMR
jgi:Transposase DDE domain group 1